ncbi:MAG: 4Fe-4S binding protein, partial [Desulfobacterales bacterium]|nr:4Fe-4S binding protein [Desulfobacterales bacterium]
LTRITKGEGREGDIDTLEELSETAMEGSLCALGKSAPNPFLSTLKYFREEYEAHIREKRCPALSCKALVQYWIDPDKCRACGSCKKKCPADAIVGAKKTIHIIDQDKCTRCGTCIEVCPDKFGAIGKLSGEPVPDPIPEDQRGLKSKTKDKVS